jgi:hypothetical protein
MPAGCFFKPVDVANLVDSGGLGILVHFWVDKASHDASDPHIQQRIFELPLGKVVPAPNLPDVRRLPIEWDFTDPENPSPLVIDHPSGDWIDPIPLSGNDQVKVEEYDFNITEDVRQAVERFWDRNGDAILAGTYETPDTDAVIVSWNEARKSLDDPRGLRQRLDPNAMNGYDWRPKEQRSGDDLKMNVKLVNAKVSDLETEGLWPDWAQI